MKHLIISVSTSLLGFSAFAQESLRLPELGPSEACQLEFGYGFTDITCVDGAGKISVQLTRLSSQNISVEEFLKVVILMRDQGLALVTHSEKFATFVRRPKDQ